MDNPIKYSAETPECFRRIEELLNSTANLERDSAVVTLAAPENQRFRSELDALKKELEAKDAELHALRASGSNVKELAHVGIQLHALKNDTATLVAESRTLREGIVECVTQAKISSENQATIHELHAKLMSEQKMNEQLTAKLSKRSKALEHMTDLSQGLRSKIENAERELEELRIKLDAAEKDRDRHRKQHTEILEVHNTLNAACTSDDQHLIQDNNQLKDRNSVLTQKLYQQYRDIGHFISQLDLATQEVRVYTCSHKDLKDITPSSDKSTRIKPIQMIADEMYRHWANDLEFRFRYKNARKTIANHHNAHWNAGHQKANAGDPIREIFQDLDRKRGA